MLSLSDTGGRLCSSCWPRNSRNMTCCRRLSGWIWRSWRNWSVGVLTIVFPYPLADALTSRNITKSNDWPILGFHPITVHPIGHPPHSSFPVSAMREWSSSPRRPRSPDPYLTPNSVRVSDRYSGFLGSHSAKSGPDTRLHRPWTDGSIVEPIIVKKGTLLESRKSPFSDREGARAQTLSTHLRLSPPHLKWRSNRSPNINIITGHGDFVSEPDTHRNANYRLSTSEQ